MSARCCGHEGIELAWFRVNFNYSSRPRWPTTSDAVHLVASEGTRLLALYRFDPFTGLWHHREARARPPVSLYDISYTGPAMEFGAVRSTAPESVLRRRLEDAASFIAALDDHSPPRPSTIPCCRRRTRRSAGSRCRERSMLRSPEHEEE